LDAAALVGFLEGFAGACWMSWVPSQERPLAAAAAVMSSSLGQLVTNPSDWRISVEMNGIGLSSYELLFCEALEFGDGRAAILPSGLSANA